MKFKVVVAVGAIWLMLFITTVITKNATASDSRDEQTNPTDFLNSQPLRGPEPSRLLTDFGKDYESFSESLLAAVTSRADGLSRCNRKIQLTGRTNEYFEVSFTPVYDWSGWSLSNISIERSTFGYPIEAEECIIKEFSNITFQASKDTPIDGRLRTTICFSKQPHRP